MKCKSCGAEISELNKFCGICGAANIIEENSSDSDSAETAREDTSLDMDAEDKRDEIDDILNSYSKSYEKNGEEETTAPAAENAVRETLEGDDSNMKKDDSVYLQQNENAQSNNAQGSNYQAGANPQYGGGNPNMRYNGYPQNGYYNPYGGYPQPPFAAPYPQPYPQNNSNNAEEDKKGKKTKQKRTVSVGVAVFCIIMVLILSAVCGYLTETCLRHGINPLMPNKTSSIVLITENNISEDMQNG